MLDGRILRSVALQLHKADVELQRRVGKQTDKIGFRRYLQRHEVEDDNAQRTNILSMRTGIAHDKYILLLQQINGRQPVG